MGETIRNAPSLGEGAISELSSRKECDGLVCAATALPKGQALFP